MCNNLTIILLSFIQLFVVYLAAVDILTKLERKKKVKIALLLVFTTILAAAATQVVVLVVLS